MVVWQCLDPHLPACTSLITLDSRLGGYAMLRVKPKWLLLAQFNYSNNSFAYIYLNLSRQYFLTMPSKRAVPWSQASGCQTGLVYVTFQI